MTLRLKKRNINLYHIYMVIIKWGFFVLFCMHLMEYVFITWAIYFFIHVWFGQFQSSTLECAVWIKPAKNRRQKTRKKERKKLYSIYIIYVKPRSWFLFELEQIGGVIKSIMKSCGLQDGLNDPTVSQQWRFTWAIYFIIVFLFTVDTLKI